MKTHNRKKRYSHRLFKERNSGSKSTGNSKPNSNLCNGCKEANRCYTQDTEDEAQSKPSIISRLTIMVEDSKKLLKSIIDFNRVFRLLIQSMKKTYKPPRPGWLALLLMVIFTTGYFHEELIDTPVYQVVVSSFSDDKADASLVDLLFQKTIDSVVNDAVDKEVTMK